MSPNVVTAPDFECLDAEQVPAALQRKALREGNTPFALLGYAAIGVYLGLLFVWSEVASWYRIQEMFLFDSFHMYGIIGSAVVVAMASVWLIKKLKIRTLHGEPIVLEPKQWGASRLPGARYAIGGILFGFGWALLGACPGPIFALLGAGFPVLIVALGAALLGTWAYALVRDRLPH